MSPELAPERGMGEASRIAHVFLDPRVAFADIAARPRFLTPLLLLIVFSVAWLAAVEYRIGWDATLEQLMERSQQTQDLSAEQRASAAEAVARIGSVLRWIIPASPVVSVPFYTLVVAGVAALVFHVFLAARVSFRQLFAIAAYASLPDLIVQAASAVVLFLKSPEEFHVENPLAFNLGAYLDPETTSRALMSIASSIDLFSFWKLGLLAVGIAVAARKLPFSTALAGVTIPWLLWVLGKTALAALRG